MTWVEFLYVVRWAENSDAVTNPTICYGRLGKMMEGISDTHSAIYLVKSRDRAEWGGEEKEKIGNQQTNFKDFDYWLISLDPLKPNCTSQIRE
jgi:hypothetical protein